eukprot:CAMPEP_0197522274 /NCGR_PEP_ID=MMETSP1318-20131121/7454_1 /TAXON_ID=552666 /ORGANISM="Partenskyella glossopodia, Strain RCC365" /LENGTH=178 /DNA_ID=CAMNT_0043074601 /DNA_START=1 /DNA_END=534 /DNA_ORIENTATION=-
MPDYDILSVLLQSVAITGDWPKIRQVLKVMYYLGVRHRIETLNALINAAAQAGDCSMAENIFHKIKLSKIKPNNHTFDALLKGYAKTRNVERAVESIEMMDVKYNIPFSRGKRRMMKDQIQDEEKGKVFIAKVQKSLRKYGYQDIRRKYKNLTLEELGEVGARSSLMREAKLRRRYGG